MKKILTILVVVFILSPSLVFAQTQPFAPINPQTLGNPAAFCQSGTCTYVPLEPLPGYTQNQNVANFGTYIATAFKLFVVLGGMIAVATFVFGGITYMTADVLNKKDFGRKQMQRSVYAILLLLGVYLILVTINPNLATLKFDPAPLRTGAPSAANTPSQAPFTITSGQPTALERADCEDNPNRRVAYLPIGGWRCEANPNQP